MLFREDVWKRVDFEDLQFAGKMLQHAIKIRGEVSGYTKDPYRLWARFRTPVCHDTAHAFAKVFGLTAVDGEHMYASKVYMTPSGLPNGANYTTCVHSWVEFETDGGTRFILDVFPDEGCAIFPVLLLHPNPAYWIPSDSATLRALDLSLRRPIFKQRVEILAAEMRKTLLIEGEST